MRVRARAPPPSGIRNQRTQRNHNAVSHCGQAPLPCPTPTIEVSAKVKFKDVHFTQNTNTASLNLMH